ncbi:hypothetical protein PG993_006129 [Apiospora rasikravindrae]|uniref:LysM domain-containing protein n=1 Tax=Apiospora rasikravindrae TaxID=990691 RepID=A0ABR1TD53_9PEZI
MKLTLQSTLLVQMACLGAAEFVEPPPTTADPSTIQDCTWWFVAGTSDTCDQVLATYGLTRAQLDRYNPVLASSCAFVSGNSYCIEQNWGQDPEPEPQPTTTATATTFTTSTRSTEAPVTTTDPGNGVETPKPIQPGMVSNCNKFAFVSPGTTCGQILSANKISLDDFVRWNPEVDDTCSGMWAKVNVCVGVLGGGGGGGATPTTRPTTSEPLPPVTATTTTTAGNGVQTPQPTQPGMVSNCNKFHWVSRGNVCDQITGYNGISREDFVRWNPTVLDDCSGMWAEVNVCVGVLVGGGPTTTTAAHPPPATTTKPPSGIQTPQPTQPGMVSNCKKFHYVSPGDACAQITTYEGISLADFTRWNTGVGADCSNMWSKTFVCVGV